MSGVTSAAWRVDDQVHPTLPDRMLVAAADTHRYADDPEPGVPEAQGHRAQCALRAAFDVAVPAHHVLAVFANPYRRPTRTVDPRLEEVAVDVAHNPRIEHAFYIAGRRAEGALVCVADVGKEDPGFSCPPGSGWDCLNACSRRGQPRNRSVLRQQAPKRLADPHGHGSFRPSFSMEATPYSRARRDRRASHSSRTGIPAVAYWLARKRSCDSRSRSLRGMVHLLFGIHTAVLRAGGSYRSRVEAARDEQEVHCEEEAP
jgi:hypothetical protein